MGLLHQVNWTNDRRTTWRIPRSAWSPAHAENTGSSAGWSAITILAMGRRLGTDQVRQLRLWSQGLAGPQCAAPADVVERVVGIQAQASAPARLAVRARRDGLVAGDVDRATGSAPPVLVRTWLMRGTLHMIRAADLDWM